MLFRSFGDVERHGNVVYTTNFMPRVRSALAFVPKAGEPILLANIGLRDVPAAKTITWVDDVRPFGRLPKDLIALIEEKRLTHAAIGVCGFEEMLPVTDWNAIVKGLSAVRWQNRDGEIKALRAVKESWEVEAIRRAGAMGDSALSLAPSVFKPGVSMRQAIAAIDLKVRSLGAEDARYMVASGPQAEISLRPVDDRVLMPGDTIILSMMTQAQRYWGETARTFVLGAVPQALSAVYKSATDGIAAMCSTILPGIRGTDIAQAAERALGGSGKSAAAYGFMNGIGLDADEALDLADGVVKEGTTLALRVILHGDGQGAAVAQTVRVGPNGCTPLNAESALIKIPA